MGEDHSKYNHNNPNKNSSTGKLQPSFAPVYQIFFSINPESPAGHSHLIEIGFFKI